MARSKVRLVSRVNSWAINFAEHAMNFVLGKRSRKRTEFSRIMMIKHWKTLQVQRYKDTETQKYQDMKVSRYESKKTQRRGGTNVSRNESTRTQAHAGIEA